jgi:hypothetical protein
MTPLPPLTSIRDFIACTRQENNLIVAGGRSYTAALDLVEKLDLR